MHASLLGRLLSPTPCVRTRGADAVLRATLLWLAGGRSVECGVVGIARDEYACGRFRRARFDSICCWVRTAVLRALSRRTLLLPQNGGGSLRLTQASLGLVFFCSFKLLLHPTPPCLWTVRLRLRCARVRAGMLAQEMVTHEGPVEQLLKGDVNPFGQF